jgi:hypothetical protein
MKSNPRK